MKKEGMNTHAQYTHMQIHLSTHSSMSPYESTHRVLILFHTLFPLTTRCSSPLCLFSRDASLCHVEVHDHIISSSSDSLMSFRFWFINDPRPHLIFYVTGQWAAFFEGNSNVMSGQMSWAAAQKDNKTETFLPRSEVQEHTSAEAAQSIYIYLNIFYKSCNLFFQASRDQHSRLRYLNYIIDFHGYFCVYIC